MAREAERKASFFGTTKQDRSRRTTCYNDRCLVWVQFSSSSGSSALISYPLSVAATSTAGIVRNAASARRKGMGSNNDLLKNPPVKSSKRRSISRRNRSNGSHCCGSRQEDFSDCTGTLLAGSPWLVSSERYTRLASPCPEGAIWREEMSGTVRDPELRWSTASRMVRSFAFER